MSAVVTSQTKWTVVGAGEFRPPPLPFDFISSYKNSNKSPNFERNYLIKFKINLMIFKLFFKVKFYSNWK